MSWYKQSQENDYDYNYEEERRDWIIGDREVHYVDGIAYMAPHYHPDLPLYEVDVDKVDKAWRNGPEDFYLMKGYDDHRRQRFMGWKEKENLPIEVPEVYIDGKGALHFSNGRHRFSVIREMGKNKTVMNVECEYPKLLQLIDAVRL